MKIFIAADHGGFELKNYLVEYLLNSNFEFEDLSAPEIISTDDYPDYAKSVCRKVLNEANSVGILICKSGNGMAIAANKHKGIYASLCFTGTHAEFARKDDNSNVLCLDSKYHTNFKDYENIVDKFLTTEFDTKTTDRFLRRFKKVQDIEANI